jgi:hypothetical protein
MKKKKRYWSSCPKFGLPKMLVKEVLTWEAETGELAFKVSLGS